MRFALRVATAFLAMCDAAAWAYPVATTLTINPDLTVDASTSGFSDSDTNSLNGTIDAVFNFGEDGTFLFQRG